MVIKFFLAVLKAYHPKEYLSRIRPSILRSNDLTSTIPYFPKEFYASRKSAHETLDASSVRLNLRRVPSFL
jgi:hypothetical protein